jgi:hypothetical protein
MAVQVGAQQLVVQGCAPFLGAGMGVCVDQSRQHPAGRDGLRVRDRIGGPAVAVRVEIDRFTGRDRGATDSEDSHGGSLEIHPILI